MRENKIIRSRDRLTNYLTSSETNLLNTPGNYAVDMTWIDVSNYDEFLIREITFPVSYYNVRGMVININATPVTVTDGNYTGTTLAAHLQARIIAVIGAGYTVSYDGTTGKFTIAGPGAFTINWTTNSTMGEILGFDTSADDTGLASYVSDNFAKLSELALTLHSRCLSRISDDVDRGDYKTNILTQVAVQVGSGSFQTVRYEVPLRFKIINKVGNFKIVDFYWTYDNGEIVNFNGVNNSVHLEFI